MCYKIIRIVKRKKKISNKRIIDIAQFISRNISSASFNFDARISRKMKHEERRGREREREQKSEETRRIESRKKIPIEAGKISKRGATSVPVELSSRGLESFPDARIRSAIPLALEYPIPPPSSSPSSPLPLPLTPRRGTRQKFSTLSTLEVFQKPHTSARTRISRPLRSIV